MKSHSPPPQNASESSEEEDYMSMALPMASTLPKKTETSIQRRQRLRREAEERGRVKSKAEKAAEEAAAREKALQTSLIPGYGDSHDGVLGGGEREEVKGNKGLAMMAKMGFKPGTALGKGGEGRVEPIGVEMKGDRGGIGLDSEKKRKFREEVEKEGKRVKAEEIGYRERIMKEKEDARLERLVGGAMRIVESMDEERDEEEQENAGKEEGDNAIEESKSLGRKSKPTRRKPLKNINILYRSLIRRRETLDREKRMRNDLQQSLSLHPSYNDPSEDADDTLAYSSNHSNIASLSSSNKKSSSTQQDAKALIMEEELEEEDAELEEFEALDPGERLERLVAYLRREYWYCFWCKFRYGGVELEGCPGEREEDHD